MDNYSQVEDQSISTSHGRISLKLKKGTGPALFLLHGNSFSSDVFAPFFNHASFAGMTLVAMDLPGHGKSENAPNAAKTYHYTGFAECVAEVAAALKLESYLVFGWSLGGQVAIEMLDRAPGLIGVATYGSAIVQRGPLGMLNGFHFTRTMLLAGKAVMSEIEAEKFGLLCCGSPIDRAQINTILRVDPALRPALSRAAMFGKDRDQRAIIAATQTPVCLMLGSNDPFISQDTFAKVSGQSIFGGKAKLIKNGGHSPFGAVSEKVVPALLHFYLHTMAFAEMPKAEPLRLAS